MKKTLISFMNEIYLKLKLVCLQYYYDSIIHEAHSWPKFVTITSLHHSLMRRYSPSMFCSEEVEASFLL